MRENNAAFHSDIAVHLDHYSPNFGMGPMGMSCQFIDYEVNPRFQSDVVRCRCYVR